MVSGFVSEERTPICCIDRTDNEQTPGNFSNQISCGFWVQGDTLLLGVEKVDGHLQSIFNLSNFIIHDALADYRRNTRIGQLLDRDSNEIMA